MADKLWDFWDERADFLKVMGVDNGEGGFDIMLRIDGTYFDLDPQSKKEHVQGWERMLKDVGLRLEWPGRFP